MTDWACECSEDYGPCEQHSDVLAQRVGASNRSADELVLVFLDDAEGIDPDVLSPYGRDVRERAQADLASHGGSWLDDHELADELRSVMEQVESYLGGYDDPIYVIWDDGYVIYKITGGPLLDL